MSRVVAADLSARSSLKKSEAIAAIKARASLIADFKNGEYKLYTPETGLARTDFATMFSFTRASVATVDTFAGVADIASGQPRFSAEKGLRIEEGRENLLTYSEEFDNADWSKANGGTGLVPTVTANYEGNADRVQFDKGSGTSTTDSSSLSQSVSGANAGIHAYTFKIKSTDGVSFYNMEIRDFNGNGIEQITVTGQYQEFTLVHNAAVTTPQIALALRGGRTPTHSDAADVVIEYAQLEKGAFPTTYIPTAASSVVRDGDDCQRTLGAEFNSTEGTLYFEANLLGAVPSSESAFIGCLEANMNLPAIQYDSNGVFRVALDVRSANNGNVDTRSFVTLSNPFETKKMAVVYSGNQADLYIGGSFVVSESADNNIGDFIQFFSLFKRIASFAPQYTGVFKELRYFPQALTADELITLTEPD